MLNMLETVARYKAYFAWPRGYQRRGWRDNCLFTLVTSSFHFSRVFNDLIDTKHSPPPPSRGRGAPGDHASRGGPQRCCSLPVGGDATTIARATPTYCLFIDPLMAVYVKI